MVRSEPSWGNPQSCLPSSELRRTTPWPQAAVAAVEEGWSYRSPRHHRTRATAKRATRAPRAARRLYKYAWVLRISCRSALDVARDPSPSTDIVNATRGCYGIG